MKISETMVLRKPPNLSKEFTTEWTNNVFANYFFMQFSLGISEAEQFILNTVQKVSWKDPETALVVKKFSIQESFHGSAHTFINKQIIAHFDSQIVKRIDTFLYNRFVARIPSIGFKLAFAVVFEHFTGSFLSIMVENMEFFESLQEPYKSLFWWHATEELEHSEVAFGLLQTYMGRNVWRAYLYRVAAMALFVGLVQFKSFIKIAIMSAKEGLIFRPKFYSDAWSFLFKKERIGQSLFRLILSFFHIHYKPFSSQTNDPRIERIRKLVDEMKLAQVSI